MRNISVKVSTLQSWVRAYGVWGAINATQAYFKYNYLTVPVVYYIRHMYETSPPEDDRVYQITVDPAHVTHRLQIPRDQLPRTGKNAIAGEVGGPWDWDYFKSPFKETNIYRTIYQRIIENRDWDQTPYYQYNLRKSSKSIVEVKKDCQEMDELIEEIQRHGYLSQEEVAHSGGVIKKSNRQIQNASIVDEPILGLDRHNNLIRLAGGNHRLAIAKVLGVEEIPAVLSVRHPKASETDRPYRRVSASNALTEGAGWRCLDETQSGIDR